MTDKHGGNVYKYRDYLDFSANINPLGTPESVRNAVIESAGLCDVYPDPYCTELVGKISDCEKIKPSRIVCGNGADDLIYRIVSALKPDNAVICSPSFTEYGKALRENNCRITEYILSERNSFDIASDFVDYLNHNTDIVFLCSPNNPTGKAVNIDLLGNIAEKCLENDIVLVCDECFMDFVCDGKNKSSRNFLNGKMIILKAFTKIYAMAGLRLGYAVFGSDELAGKVCSNGQYWSVSVPAQRGGIAALDEKNYLLTTVEFVRKERKFLTTELSDMGLKVFESEANFIFFRSSLPLDTLLEKEKILIRNCNNYCGLENGFFRVAVRTHEENIILVSALRRILNG